MRFFKAAILGAGLLLVLFLASGIWLRSSASDPYSSPTAIRTNEFYHEVRGPGTNLPTFSAEVFKGVSIREEGANLTVTYPPEQEHWPRDHFGNVTIHHANGTGPVQIGDGSIRLAYIGVITERPAGVVSSSFRDLTVPATYFTPDLKPAQPDDPVLKLEPYRNELPVLKWPYARFILTCSNLVEFMSWRFAAFDARTHYTVRNYDHYGTIPFRDTLRFDAYLNLWHQTPIELVATLAMGPVKTYSMPAVEGAELIFPGGAIKLLAIAEGILENAHGIPTAPRNVATFTEIPSSPEEPPYFSLVLHCWPPAGIVPWEIECYDDAGNKMDMGYNASSWPIAIRAGTGTPDTVKEIRVRHYPNLHRVIFTIPELPGLPEENRNVRNLFDVRVPFIEPRDSFARIDLGHTVQMRVGLIGRKMVKRNPAGNQTVTVSNNTVTISGSDGTRTFSEAPSPPPGQTNFTARMIFDEIADDLPEYERLVADPEKNEIRSRRQFLAIPLEAVKRFFGR